MRQVIFTLSAEEKIKLATAAQGFFDDMQCAYTTNPVNYNSPVENLVPMWREVAKSKAIFQQLVNDGIASIRKQPDRSLTFDAHARDAFQQNSDDNIHPEDLDTKRRREMARFNREGAWYHTLTVLDNELDSMGGFVGNDFNSSGLNIEFYALALTEVEKQLPDYHFQLINAVNDI